MIGTYSKRGEEQLLAAWMLASSVGLGRHKDCVNIFKRFGIVGLQNPALLVQVVLIQYAQTASLLLVRPSSSPHLEGAGILQSRLAVKIIGVEDQLFPAGVEDSAVGLAGFPFAVHVVHFRNIKVTSSHQLPDVAVPLEQFLLLCYFPLLPIEILFSVPNELCQFADLGIESSRAGRGLVALSG